MAPRSVLVAMLLVALVPAAASAAAPAADGPTTEGCDSAVNCAWLAVYDVEYAVWWGVHDAYGHLVGE